MRPLALAFGLLAMLAGCGDDQAPAVDVAGAWSYDWQVREPAETWDGHWHGALVLEQHGADVTGTLGYPTEDPAAMFGDPSLRDAWRWKVYGVTLGAELHLFAPAPSAAWDDDWKFHLAVTPAAMTGPSWAGAAEVEKWPFSATR